MIRCFGGPCGPAKPSILDEITSNILEVMFTALRQNLVLIIALVERISNIVDGRTPPPPPPCHLSEASRCNNAAIPEVDLWMG